VKQIDDPSSFGVVKLNDSGIIIDYIEKPKNFVSDLAMIGIYYFKNGEDLAEEIKYLIDNKVVKGGEYQLPDALKRLTDKGHSFVPGKVDAWMDCGNAKVTIDTNEKVLRFKYPESQLSESAALTNSLVIDPCFIGNNVKLENSVVGPYVSIGNDSVVADSRIERSIVQENTTLRNIVAKNSMIGSRVSVEKKAECLNLGDYNTLS